MADQSLLDKLKDYLTATRGTYDAGKYPSVDAQDAANQQMQDQQQAALQQGDALSAKLASTPIAPDAPQGIGDLQAQEDEPDAVAAASAALAKDRATASVPQAPSQPATNSSDDSNQDSSTPAPQSDSDKVKQYLMQKYGLGNGTDALMLAQRDSADETAKANMQHAADQIGQALSRGSNPVDNSFYQAQLQQAQNPIKNLQALQQAKTEGLKNESSIDELARTQEAEDPNSQVSKSTQAFYKGLLARNPNVTPEMLKMLNGMSAADISKYGQGVLDTTAKLQEMMQMKEMQLAQIKANKDLMLNNQLATHVQQAAGRYDNATKSLDDNDRIISKARTMVADATTNATAAGTLYQTLLPAITESKRNGTYGSGMSPAILDKANRILTSLTKGPLDKNDAGYVTQLLDHLADSNNQTRKIITDKMSTKLSALYPSLSKDRAAVLISGNTVDNQPSQNSPAPSAQASQLQSDPRVQQLLSKGFTMDQINRGLQKKLNLDQILGYVNGK